MAPSWYSDPRWDIRWCQTCQAGVLPGGHNQEKHLFAEVARLRSEIENEADMHEDAYSCLHDVLDSPDQLIRQLFREEDQHAED